MAPPEVELAAASRMPPELAARELGHLAPGLRVAKLGLLRAEGAPPWAVRVLKVQEAEAGGDPETHPVTFGPKSKLPCGVCRLAAGR